LDSWGILKGRKQVLANLPKIRAPKGANLRFCVVLFSGPALLGSKRRLGSVFFGPARQVQDFFLRLVQDRAGIEYGPEGGKKVRFFSCENQE